MSVAGAKVVGPSDGRAGFLGSIGMTPTPVRLFPLVGALTLGLLLAPVAGASSPPRRQYQCSNPKNNLPVLEQVHIRSSSTYNDVLRKKGSYSTVGKTITFKTGPYRTLYYGVWKEFVSPNVSPTYQIRLYGKRDRKLKYICS